MNLFATLRIAERALAKNKMRAALTILGVVIGIAAVTTMVSLGQSAGSLVQGQLQSFGTNVIIVAPAMMRAGGIRDTVAKTLTWKDAEAIVEECTAVLADSPIVTASGQLIYGNSNWSANEMNGVGIDFLMVGRWTLARGEFFSSRDVSSASKVCVIGHTVAVKLFQTTNPVGQTIRIRNIPFRIIGVLEAKGAGLGGQDQDNIVLMPFTTARKRLQGSNFSDVSFIMVSAKSAAQTPEAVEQIKALLQERHRVRAGDPIDFQVQSMSEFANALAVVTGTFTLMLSAIAGISLLVGGVGIMNIMLVSVTERTREIGIRMAVGARGKDILRQFLVEAVLLSSLGGAVGIALGISASVGLTKLINTFLTGPRWPVVVSIPAAIIAMVFAAAVGVFFGYYPARRASRLDPIDALRYE